MRKEHDGALRRPWRTLACSVLLALMLAACGGSGGGNEAGGDEPPPAADEAARFLAQASFGATEAQIEEVSRLGYSAWLREQFAEPQTLHRQTMNGVAAGLAADARLNQNHFFQSWWQQAVTGDDQLRQRVAFALSQIFVVSLADGNVGNHPRGVASYYDMLGEKGFGNYRELLEAVALHPMMGVYLSHLRNQKEDAASGRMPDENFAREVMQLFSIGLHELNADGSLRLGADGQPIEAYTNADIQGLAKVFTGWSWYAGDNAGDRTRSRFFGNDAHPDRDWQPMQPYSKFAPNTDFHSVSAKSFLGVAIPVQSTPDPQGDLKAALDRLAGHPNVGPFLGRQLIQRLVTSNPSPAYVRRVSAAFAGKVGGTRGDMRALITAVLLDPEARSIDPASRRAGKLREPVLRLANLLRAAGARSTSGRFTGIDNTDDAATRLGQSPMRPPSVFSFYRPGYSPSGTGIAEAGLVAPELQLAHEVSVAGYLNYLRGWLTTSNSRDVQLPFTAESALADTPDQLVERFNRLLMGGQMPLALRAQIETAVIGRAIPAAQTGSAGQVSNQAAIDSARRDRAAIAAYLVMAAPDYLIQK